MPWRWALRAVPWRTILRHAPTIVDAARTVYGSGRAADAAPPRRDRGTDALARAVEDIEARQEQQATLFADVTRQLEEVASALEVLRTRTTFALTGAGIAIALTLATAGLVLLRLR